MAWCLVIASVAGSVSPDEDITYLPPNDNVMYLYFILKLVLKAENDRCCNRYQEIYFQKETLKAYD